MENYRETETLREAFIGLYKSFTRNVENTDNLEEISDVDYVQKSDVISEEDKKLLLSSLSKRDQFAKSLEYPDKIKKAKTRIESSSTLKNVKSIKKEEAQKSTIDRERD